MLRWLRAEPFRIVTRRVARVQHLWKISRTSEVPRVILEAELERLRETVAHLTAFVLPDR